MAPESDEFTVRKSESETRTTFYISSDKGYLTSQMNHLTSDYEVIDYYVYQLYRRQGHGKELLKFSVDHAREIGARALFGTNVVSRESLDVVRSVLGVDNIHVENVGDYTTEGQDVNYQNRTKAAARFNLKDNQ